MNIGIDLGGSHIAVGLVNEDNIIVTKKEHIWEKAEKEDLIKNIEIFCKKLIKEILQENNNVKIDKIGIGYPSKSIIEGVVHTDDGIFDLAGILFKEFNIPVYLKNDVKCSGLCEKNIGSLKKYDNCIFMTLGTGIGSAYFYKNEMVVPNKYLGFEIGHMTIEVNGRKCRCGRKGCFEEYASMRVFRKEIEKLFNIQNLNSFKMFEILESKEKEKEVERIIEKYIEYLSVGISNIINIFEPDAISIGGSFTYYADIFMDKLRKNLQEKFKGREIPDILLAKYENDAGIIGSSMLNSNK